MATTPLELIKSCNGLNDIEVSKFNTSILMTLFEESQVEECDDDERLTSVIQSLEAEIAASIPQDHTSSIVVEISPSDDHEEQMESCSSSADNYGFSWADDCEISSSSLGVDMNTWLIDEMVESVAVEDYYSWSSSGIPFVEGSSSLWQNTSS